MTEKLSFIGLTNKVEKIILTKYDLTRQSASINEMAKEIINLVVDTCIAEMRREK